MPDLIVKSDGHGTTTSIQDGQGHTLTGVTRIEIDIKGGEAVHAILHIDMVQIDIQAEAKWVVTTPDGKWAEIREIVLADGRRWRPNGDPA